MLANSSDSVTVTSIMSNNRLFNPLLLIGFVVAAAIMAMVGFFWLGDSKPITAKPLPAPAPVATAPSSPSKGTQSLPPSSGRGVPRSRLSRGRASSGSTPKTPS